MKFTWMIAFLLTCIHVSFASGAEPALDEARLISDAGIRWLAFDDWGKKRPDDAPGRKGDWLGRLREQLAKRQDKSLPVKTYIAEQAVFSGTYDLSKRALQVAAPLPPGVWDRRCLYIEISSTVPNQWNVALKLDAKWSYIEIRRDKHNYYVASFNDAMNVD